MDTVEWGYVVALWVFAPIIQACVYVTILGCLTHSHKLQGSCLSCTRTSCKASDWLRLRTTSDTPRLGCAAVVVLVLAAKQAVVRPNPDAYGAVGAASFAVVMGAAIRPVRVAAEGLADNIHILFDEVSAPQLPPWLILGFPLGMASSDVGSRRRTLTTPTKSPQGIGSFS